MNNLHVQSPSSAQPIKLLELVEMAAQENLATAMKLTAEMEQFADRMQGSLPTPIKTGDETPLRPAEPPMIDRLRAVNDDMATVIARLQTVVSRITSLA